MNQCLIRCEDRLALWWWDDQGDLSFYNAFFFWVWYIYKLLLDTFSSQSDYRLPTQNLIILLTLCTLPIQVETALMGVGIIRIDSSILESWCLCEYEWLHSESKAGWGRDEDQLSPLPLEFSVFSGKMERNLSWVPSDIFYWPSHQRV